MRRTARVLRSPTRIQRALALLPLLLLVASCKDATAPRVPAGTLRINTANLPSHLTANFGLTKTGGTTRQVAGNTDITGLEVGEYTLPVQFKTAHKFGRRNCLPRLSISRMGSVAPQHSTFRSNLAPSRLLSLVFQHRPLPTWN